MTISFQFNWLTKKLFFFSSCLIQLVQQSPGDLGELYSQVVTSPSKKYFLVVLMTFIGVIFIIGLFCGRITRRTIALKNKWNLHIIHLNWTILMMNFFSYKILSHTQKKNPQLIFTIFIWIRWIYQALS